MRTTRIAAAVVAALLATAGVVMVMMYVQGADERAAAELEPTAVLIVTDEIAEGSEAVVGTNVELQELPSRAVASGALNDLGSLNGKVATSTLFPGEQVFAERFAPPEVLTNDAVLIPKEMVQVTVSLTPDRVIGGKLKAGDTVGLVMSGEATSEEDEGQAVSFTQTILHGVLVARVQAVAPPEGEASDQPPTDAHFITFAVTAADAERIVFAAEHARIWLTLEREESDISGTGLVTLENVVAS
ncbi:Flp pilus assembly protein CpaB [Tessaracoccus oleiagri]|uniref:Pilus assembly protein CpaB n=1 Tax=Tessaracoccus oleiagri TaxID=686624 RepID=A0A1G9JUA1_9ACTN|nr:Flp pilus assembly protein CpaB [Tessaracoccus oleiagri]SDL41061.1 pilus assembly protein CpaB [Tessaracoccus oleiagri]